MSESTHTRTFNLSRQQKKTKPKAYGVQCYDLAKNSEYFKSGEVKLKPVCYISGRFGHYLTWGVFYEDQRMDNSKEGMVEADCYHWIWKNADTWVQDQLIDKMILGID